MPFLQHQSLMNYLPVHILQCNCHCLLRLLYLLIQHFKRKSFTILKHTLPISLARISNQIVFVCAFLTNFKPVLVPSRINQSTNEVDKYFEDIDSDESKEEYSDSDND